jgi:F0F1-type ATP synthase membrane subunit c/vacuolar-type H+-ATPase subunit K
VSPLVMTAFAALAAATGIGWISASTWRPVEPPVRGEPSGRSLAIISMAFCEGMAVLGVVAGLLAIFMDVPVAPIDEALAAALPIAGAVLGVVLVVRDRAATDPKVAIFAANFILGLGVLGAVVSYLGTIIADHRVDLASPGPYVFLGLAQLIAIVGIAVTSASSIQAMRGADLAAAKAILARQVLRSTIFELVGVGAFVIALLFIVAGPGAAALP